MKEIISDNKTPKLRWEYKAHNDLLPIPYAGSPYIFLGKKEFCCHQGKDLCAKKKESYVAEKNAAMVKDHVYRKSRKLTQPTKKMDCPVKFCVKKIFRFISYTVSTDTKNNREKLNIKLRNDISCLREDKSDHQYGVLQYLVYFPEESGHKFHYKGEAASIIQPVDEKVSEFVRKQIREGCRVAKDIQSRTEYFVKETLFGGQVTRDAAKNKFVPSRKKIRNLILSVRNETRYSKIDQENITQLKEQWKEYGDVLFEPFVRNSVNEEKIDLCSSKYRLYRGCESCVLQ